MILIGLFGIGLVAGLSRGGSFRNLATLQVRHAWLPLLAFALQAGFVLFPRDPSAIPASVRTVVLFVTYGSLIFFLLLNRRLPGGRLLLVGAALNAAVMLANRGFMPVTPEALARSGHTGYIVAQGSDLFVLRSKDIVLQRQDTRLWFLSDVFGIPAPLPFSSNFSLGDLLIGLGAAWLTYRGMTQGGSNPERASAAHAGDAATADHPRKEFNHGSEDNGPDDRPGIDRPALSRSLAKESA